MSFQEAHYDMSSPLDVAAVGAALHGPTGFGPGGAPRRGASLASRLVQAGAGLGCALAGGALLAGTLPLALLGLAAGGAAGLVGGARCVAIAPS